MLIHTDIGLKKNSLGYLKVIEFLGKINIMTTGETTGRQYSLNLTSS